MPAAVGMRSVAGFIPDTIAGLQSWYDSGRPGAVFADGDAVGTWKDLSGYGHDLVQATASKKPKWRSSNPNLLTYNQATAETDLTGFAPGYQCATAVSATQKLHGLTSVRITTSGDSGNHASSVTTTYGTSGIPVTAGATYTCVASAYRATRAGSIDAYIGWYNSAGTYLSRNTQNLTSAALNTWTQSTSTATAPTGAAYARAGIEIQDTLNNDVTYTDCWGFWSGSDTTWVAPVVLPGGRPVVQFDGADDVLSVADTAALDLTTMSVYVAASRSTNPTGFGAILGKIDTAQPTLSSYDLSLYNGLSRFTMRPGTPGSQDKTASWTVTNPAVISAVVAASSLSIRNNGGTTQTDSTNTHTASAGNTQPFCVGGRGPADSFSNCSVAAVLIYNTAHDLNTRRRLERWLGQQYGIAVAQ